MEDKPKRISRRRFLQIAASSAGAVSILAACGGPPASSTQGSAVPAGTAATGATGAAATVAAKPSATAAGNRKVAEQISTANIKKGGTLIEGSNTDVRTLNPVLVSDTSSGRITSLIFDGLVFLDPDTLQPQPNLATKWEVSGDGKVYTFTIKDGVKWHDDQPFSAEDVKFSYDLYMNKDTGTPRAGTLVKHIKSVEVKAPNMVVFTLNDVVAPFMASDVGYGIVPKHILSSVAPKDLPTSEFTKSKPIGTGPFKFKEQKAGESVALVANAAYHRGAPALDGYIWKFVKDTSALYQQLKTGDVDYTGIQASFYEDAKAQTNITVYEYDTFGFQFFGYDLTPDKGPVFFRDQKVRQALFYGVDREGIVKKVRYGLSTVAQGTMPLLSWAYQPDKITTRYDYDPKKANQLLDEAGYVKGPDGIRAKDGNKLAFTMYTYSGDKTIEGYMTVFQQNWKDLGVEMTPQYEEFSAFVTRITKTFDFQAFMVGFSWGVDPDQQTMWDSKQHGAGFNIFNYSNPKVDELLDQGLKTLDQEKRKQIYLEMQNIILADAPALITDFPKALAGVNKRVGNLIPNAVNVTAFAHQWYVTDGK
ncbi:MAG: peptide-binding protein [Herpetosiphon sp.]